MLQLELYLQSNLEGNDADEELLRLESENAHLRSAPPSCLYCSSRQGGPGLVTLAHPLQLRHSPRMRLGPLACDL